MKWLEISFILNAELAEAVADLLWDYAHQGLAIDSADTAAGDLTGPVRVRGYLPADDDSELATSLARFEAHLARLRSIQSLPPAGYARLEDDDTIGIWTNEYKPMRFGARLVIIPAWYSPPLEAADVPVWIDPGRAFGAGMHPSTQICLELLDAYVMPGQRVLDLGCGTGILSVAATRLGAAGVLAVDHAQVAIDATRQNALINDVADRIEICHGSLDTLPDSGWPPFDLIAGNLIAEIIIPLLQQGLDRLLLPAGTFIFSGIRVEQAQQVHAALTAGGFEVLQTRQSGNWVALAARRISA